MRSPSVYALILLAILPALTSCRQSRVQVPQLLKKSEAQSDLISEDELSQRLNTFGEQFSLSVQGTCDRVTSECTEPETLRSVVRWRSFTINSCLSTLHNREPLAAFIDTWTLLVQLENFLRTGEGKELLGHWSVQAIETAEFGQREIYEVGSLFLDPPRLERAQAAVEEFATENPMTSGYTRRANIPSQTIASQRGVFEEVLSVPLVPFKPLSGLDNTAQAVSEFTAVADFFTRTVKSLPEQTRWETELFLYDLEERPAVIETRQKLRQLAESSERLSRAAAELPQQLRKEATAALQELEEAQPEFRRTLEASRETGAQLDQTLQEATALGRQLEATSEKLAAAGESWRELFLVIDGWVQAGRKAPAASPDSKTRIDESGGYDIHDYERTAEAITQAGGELRTLVAEIRSFSSSPELARSVETLEEQRAKTLTESSQTAREIVDHLAWRIAQLLALIFIGGLAYRWILKPKAT